MSYHGEDGTMADENLSRKGPVEDEKTESPEINFCVLTVGNRTFSLPIDYVREITDAENIQALPGSPEYVKGLFHLRGAEIPVIDLGLLSGAVYRYPSEARLVVVDHKGEYLALMSDGMPDLSENREGEIIEMDTFFENYRVK